MHERAECGRVVPEILNTPELDQVIAEQIAKKPTLLTGRDPLPAEPGRAGGRNLCRAARRDPRASFAGRERSHRIARRRRGQIGSGSGRGKEPSQDIVGAARADAAECRRTSPGDDVQTDPAAGNGWTRRHRTLTAVPCARSSSSFPDILSAGHLIRVVQPRTKWERHTRRSFARLNKLNGRVPVLVEGFSPKALKMRDQKISRIVSDVIPEVFVGSPLLTSRPRRRRCSRFSIYSASQPRGFRRGWDECRP